MAKELTPDWILQETLSVQRQAIMDYVSGQSTDKGLTLTVLGCGKLVLGFTIRDALLTARPGTMGIAILGGILDSLASISSQKSSDTPASSETVPPRLPNKFNACVRRQQSAKRVATELGKYDSKLAIHENENLRPVQEADVILLGCKPYMVGDILDSDEMRSALKGKLLISILAGVTEAQLAKTIYGPQLPADACTIVRVMPNTAAAVRESMTVIGTTETALPKDLQALITWMFTRIGRVVHLPSANMDVCTALCGSGPAFAAMMLESMAAGAIAMGLPRDEAYTMAAQTMRGTTGLVLAGEHPAILRDKVTTPGGCTIGGLLVLEEGCLRGTVAKAVREATVVASQLGEGKKGVNGTRF